MSVQSRTRVVNQLSWAVESMETRARRREVLIELDGYLTQLEESNLRGYEIPEEVLAGLQVHGVEISPDTPPAELIEAIFAVQEKYMRQPEPAEAASDEMSRRIAS